MRSDNKRRRVDRSDKKEKVVDVWEQERVVHNLL
jgi:hypothetical protein